MGVNFTEYPVKCLQEFNIVVVDLSPEGMNKLSMDHYFQCLNTDVHIIDPEQIRLKYPYSH